VNGADDCEIHGAVCRCGSPLREGQPLARNRNARKGWLRALPHSLTAASLNLLRLTIPGEVVMGGILRDGETDGKGTLAWAH
jgi:hypothetical protein